MKNYVNQFLMSFEIIEGFNNLIELRFFETNNGLSFLQISLRMRSFTYQLWGWVLVISQINARIRSLIKSVRQYRTKIFLF